MSLAFQVSLNLELGIVVIIGLDHLNCFPCDSKKNPNVEATNRMHLDYVREYESFQLVIAKYLQEKGSSHFIFSKDEAMAM